MTRRRKTTIEDVMAARRRWLDAPKMTDSRRVARRAYVRAYMRLYKREPADARR